MAAPTRRDFQEFMQRGNAVQRGGGVRGGGRGDFQPQRAGNPSADEILARVQLMRAQRQAGTRVDPMRQLALDAAQGGGNGYITKAQVYEMLVDLGIRGRIPIPVRTDSDASAASIAVSTVSGYEAGMGVLCIQQSTGVAVGAVPVHTKAHLGVWSMDGVPMFDNQGIPFFPTGGNGQVSYFEIDRPGQTLTGTVTCSFPAADVGLLVTSIFLDAAEAQYLAEMLIG